MLNLEPQLVWKHFSKLCEIPRGSGNEENAGRYVISVAESNGLEYKTDDVGNVLIKVPGTSGRDNDAVTVLQGHLDMVCEKNSSTEHDFTRDPIRPRIDGGWVKATGTTLGADNGIGVAYALALAEDKDCEHGPLELLFTVDEERGLVGANNLKEGFVTGRRLLNLDTEEDGELYVGCAGGMDTVISLQIQRGPAADSKGSFKLSVEGLRGGHSGSDIHEGRGNANRILVRAFWALEKEGIQFDLLSVEGGSKRNAIPREAFAFVALAPGDSAKAGQVLKHLNEAVAAELAGLDDGVTLSLSQAACTDAPLTPESRKKLIDLLGAVPHGVLYYSREIPGLVETSTNFATVEASAEEVTIGTSQRSSVMSRLHWAGSWIASIARAAGANVEHSSAYPGWEPNLSSPILKQAQQTYKSLFDKVPEPKAIHAGLECGLIGANYPGMDMVSLGPEIRNAHSPDEMVEIESVQKTWRYLREILKALR
ncbi:MAG: aminoacyl-histidine dipeptidase [Acidobacteriota bacterium]